MSPISRLGRIQRSKDIRRALVFIVLTLILVFILFFVGIPLLINMAIFLGNLRTSSKLPEKGDIISPSPPQIIVPFEATNSSQLTLRGFSEPGSIVKVYNVGSSLGEVLADNDGSFVIENLRLTVGRNEFTAMAQDSAGNESQSSSPIVIDYDNSPPALEITNPSDGTIISGINNRTTIEGKSEENVRLTINGRSVIVGPEGSFNYPCLLNEGENIFTLIAQDKAGNQTKKEIKINYSP